VEENIIGIGEGPMFRVWRGAEVEKNWVRKEWGREGRGEKSEAGEDCWLLVRCFQN